MTQYEKNYVARWSSFSATVLSVNNRQEKRL